jgi:bacterioferritin
MSMEHIRYINPEPYPTVEVEGPNFDYANLILSDMGGANSEMSAVSIYIYNHFITKSEENLSSVFKQIAISEMRHMDILGELALLLGAEPRLWEKSFLGMRYWTPAYLTYNTQREAILEQAINGELEAISKYRLHMEKIGDKYVQANIARIIKDEEVHIEILKELLNN